MAELKKVADRGKLKPRREPYWHAVSTGNFLGFRRMSAGSEGTWIARSRDGATGKQRLNALGSFDALSPSERFEAARIAAEAWFRHLSAGGSTEVATVKDACSRYVSRLENDKRLRTAADAKARFRRWVDDAPLGQIELGKLSRDHVKAWRRALERQPVRVGKAEKQREHERSASALNRDMSALRAALNNALADGLTTTDFAWTVPLKPVSGADRRRDLYLDRDQRRKLIGSAASDTADFLRGLSLLPLRPGALAALIAASFDRRLGTLTVGKDKAGADRKINLPAGHISLLERLTASKLPKAPLFARADGQAWNKDAWKHPVKDAARAAGLPDATTAYALRHSVITDLVKVQRLDLLTMAQIAGTSVAMIEKHYGHLLRDHATTALEGLAL